MTLHLIKLCVGVTCIEDLAQWQGERLAEKRKKRQPETLVHTTFQTPKRKSALLDGGSLYWVIKGVVQVRQRLVGLEEGAKEDGTPCCLLVLDPKLVPVRPVPRRAFQGWRYLPAEDAPPDLNGSSADDIAALPPRMRKDLAELGLI
jgi:hypothetical protein